MTQITLPNEFYYALVSFLLQTKQQMMTVANEFGLTGIQALTLLSMRGHHQKSMSDLCKLYNCDASNITGIIDGLEEKGLVTRQPHPNDRRVKIIHLEKAGHDLQKKLITRVAKTSPDLFANLTESETNEFARLIEKIATAE